MGVVRVRYDAFIIPYWVGIAETRGEILVKVDQTPARVFAFPEGI